MNNVVITPVRPSGVPPSNMTDDEIISFIKTAYPRMGPALGVLVQRFEDAVDRLEGRSPFDSFKPDRVSCPHCGSALLLHSSNPQQKEHLDGT